MGRKREEAIYEIEGQKLNIHQIWEMAKARQPDISFTLIQKRLYIDGNRRWENLAKPPQNARTAGKKKWSMTNATLFRKRNGSQEDQEKAIRDAAAVAADLKGKAVRPCPSG